MTLRKTTKLETEELLKRYISHQKTPALGATGQGGLKLFVDDLKQRLHLPMILNRFGDKLWGYKLAALVLVLLCRPQLGANSIAALREKLLCRFICRLFYIRWESNAAEKRPKRKASVDVLYDLFEKLDKKQIRQAINNHIKRMRREGKIPKKLDLVIDSAIIELSVKRLSKSRFEKIGGRKIRDKYYRGFKVYVAIDLSTKALLYIDFCPISTNDSEQLIPIVKAVRKLKFRPRSAIFDRGFWKAENFAWLHRRGMLFYTVLKHYTDENRALVASINSRSPGRRKLRDGVWVTEVTPICLPKYLKTKRLRCFVVRMRGKQPWAVLTNDETTDACWAVDFYLKRNRVEKVIQELLDDYSLSKLPRSAFDENTCWVLLTAWSYNLFLDFKMTLFGVKQTEILRRKLQTLRRQILDVSAVVRYVRKMMILEFEHPPPLLAEVLSALT